MTPIFILEFVVAIAVMILVHEFGHFLACRFSGIEVEEFGIGLPPRAIKLFKARGTDFTLNWIPLGGFVRPKGELDAEVPGGLASAPAWKRIFVAISGPLMNLITAIILYITLILLVGEPDPNRLNVAEIQGVMAGSPAASAGLIDGDIILSINDIEISSEDHARQLLKENLDQEITLMIQRSDDTFETKATPLSSRDEMEGALGVIIGVPTRPVNFIDSLWSGVRATFDHVSLIFRFIGDLITGSLVVEDDAGLLGPVGMGEMYVQIRQYSPANGVYPFVDAIFFFINITLSLALFNLIPIPALDGGHIVLALPELLIRRRLPKKIENVLNYGSYYLLLLLMILVLMRDVLNLFID